MPNPTLSAGAQLARTTLLTTPEYYGLVNLALASYAYTDSKSPTSGNNIVVTGDLQASIQSLPQLPIPPNPSTVAGVWNVVWGPCYSPDYSNLIYAATYSDGGTQEDPGPPIFVAVSIRGTDTSTDGEGLLNQIYQDMEAVTTVEWPDFPGARIAAGTMAGLQKLLGLTPGATAYGSGTIQQCIQGLLDSDPALPIVVTGHSLGACQATVMAPYLWKNLNLPASQVVLAPYAPPTAGNGDFVSLVLNQLPARAIWANQLDLIPKAYSEINSIKQLWETYTFSSPAQKGPALDPVDKVIIDLMVLIGGPTHDYTQPALLMLQDAQNPLPQLPSEADMNTFLAKLNNTKDPWDSWPAQLMWQHFPPCYWLSICAEYASQVAPFYGPTLPPITQDSSS